MYVCIPSSSFGQMRWVWVVALSFNTTTKQTQRNVAPGEELHLWIELNTKVHARRPSNLENLERFVKEEWALPRRHVWDLVHNWLFALGVCVLNLNKIGVHYAPQSSPGSPLSLLQLTICAHARVNSGPPKDIAVLYDVLTTVMFTWDFVEEIPKPWCVVSTSKRFKCGDDLNCYVCDTAPLWL